MLSSDTVTNTEATFQEENLVTETIGNLYHCYGSHYQIGAAHTMRPHHCVTESWLVDITMFLDSFNA